MAASDLVKVAHIFKRRYSGNRPGDMAERDHPLMTHLAKKGGFTGTSFTYAIHGVNPQGFGRSVSQAQAAATGSKGIQLEARRVKKFGLITLDGESMAAADGDHGSFVSLVTQESDGVMEEFGDDLSFECFRDASGRRGQVAAIAGNVITLTDPANARWFKEGMTLVRGAAADGSDATVDTQTVDAVDEEGTGEVTLSGPLVGLAIGDYLFRQGAEANALQGLDSLFPLVAPVLGSDNFRGVDRGRNPSRYAGVRVNDPGSSIVHNAGLVATKIRNLGKRAQRLYLSPLNFWDVSKALDAKIEYEVGGKHADVAFEHFTINTPAGAIKAYADPDCQSDRGWVLNTSTIYCKTLKGFPHIIKDDGRGTLRVSDDDAIEARLRSMGNMICTLPGSNGSFSI